MDGLNYIYGPIQPSPDGKSVAFIVKAPNLRKNTNDYSLYIDSTASSNKSPTLALAADYIQHITWMEDGRHLAVLKRLSGRSSIVFIDTKSLTHQDVVTEARTILEYSIDPAARLIAFTSEVDKSGQATAFSKSADQNATGYSIPWTSDLENLQYPREELFVSRAGAQGVWSPPQRLRVNQPFSDQTVTSLQALRYISVSTDGRLVAFSFVPDSIPVGWKNDPMVSDLIGHGGSVEMAAVVVVATGKLSIPLNSIGSGGPVMWSRDSRSFLFIGGVPIQSMWEAQDNTGTHLLTIDVQNGTVQQIARQLPNDHESPLGWNQNGEVMVQVTGGAIGRFAKKDGAWQPI
jgi:hypothetical protein